MERHLVPTDHGHVHLRASGPAAGTPPVLLIHQSPSSSRMWMPVMETVGAGTRCVAVDLLGYGESDPPSRQLSLEEHAETILEAVRKIEPRPFVVVGHHTGAVLAAEIAGAHPEATAGLLLSGYPLYPSWQTKFSRLGPALRPTEIDEDGGGLHEIWQHVTRPLEPGASDELRLQIFTDRLRAGRTWFTGYAQLLAADLDGILSRAADPGRPTITLVADRDPLAPFADAVGEVLGVEPIRIDGTSWVTYEHPDRLAEQIDALVGQVAGHGAPR